MYSYRQAGLVQSSFTTVVQDLIDFAATSQKGPAVDKSKRSCTLMIHTRISTMYWWFTAIFKAPRSKKNLPRLLSLNYVYMTYNHPRNVYD